MYNGIGLTTPRGSGTNGYVQRNLSSVRAKRTRDERGDERDEKDRERLESQLNRQPNAGILEHQRKRQLEVKCAELQDMMEEQGYSAEEIAEKVNSFRLMLQEKQEPPASITDRPTVTDTHALAAANQQKNDRLREAFGIATDYVDGSSFHPERKEREKEKREQQRLERERQQQQQQQKYVLVEDSEDSASPSPRKQNRKKRRKKNKKRDSSESPSPSPQREKKSGKKKKKSSSGDRQKEKGKRKRSENESPAPTKHQRHRSPSITSDRSQSPAPLREKWQNQSIRSSDEGRKGWSPGRRGRENEEKSPQRLGMREIPQTPQQSRTRQESGEATGHGEGAEGSETKARFLQPLSFTRSRESQTAEEPRAGRTISQSQLHPRKGEGDRE
ncbi:hypothetical protein JZ751_015167 [Albula glossodonta]|uniref:CWF21 domain-containing protein n=1 Tax=Albula glossodonta TaxID=121402 RepID=A0A8T2NV13_9TELE|nr:hypothetical protein JZ751_015167 [Albula glossodonta]